MPIKPAVPATIAATVLTAAAGRALDHRVGSTEEAVFRRFNDCSDALAVPL